jgi:hypothetical protein
MARKIILNLEWKDTKRCHLVFYSDVQGMKLAGFCQRYRFDSEGGTHVVLVFQVFILFRPLGCLSWN